MQDFSFYGTINNVDWWQCNHCFNKTRGKPNICPVCRGQSKLFEAVKAPVNTDAVFNNLIGQYEDLFKKYGG